MDGPQPRSAWPLVLITVAALALALLITAALADDRLVPDPTLTPGVVASTDEAAVCGIVGGLSYSKRHRVTPPEMKTEVRQRYGMARCGEIDHLLPLALGGADAVENLWCQSDGPWGYKTKDRLETRVWQMTCHEHSMTLAAAQAIFIGQDWRIGFCKIVGGSPCP